MFVPYRERSVQVGMRVRVYRNLLKPNFFSIQAMEGPDKGKVVGYARAVGLENVRFVVSKKTWERVISEGVRTVFAFADGALVDCLEALPAGFDERITLMPFERCYFFNRQRPEIPVTEAARGYLFGADFWGTAELAGLAL